MTIDAMLAAMCAVLGVLSLDLGNMSVTFEDLPVLLGAMLFGPADGAAIGFAGNFVYQMLRYGFSATTLLWILPFAVCGALAGACAKKGGFALTAKQTMLTVLASELVITTLNTGVLYIDSKIYGYYSAVYIFGTLLPRYALCIAKAAAYSAVMPALIRTTNRAAGGRKRSV
jgi:ECF transporter S component (folate family)